jgi:uncharacterized membrane protein YhiD involved in acid resistance
MACGFGFYAHAAVTTAIAAVVLTVLGMVEARLLRAPEDSRRE